MQAVAHAGLEPKSKVAATAGGDARPMTVAIYADINPNLIDGSSIWLQSMALCWLQVPGVRVIVVLREPLSSPVVLGPVHRAGGTTKTIAELCADASSQAMVGSGPAHLEIALDALDKEVGVDLFVVRGERHIRQLSGNERLRRRVWGYWLRRPRILEPWLETAFLEVVDRIDKVVVQSEAYKSIYETVLGVPSSKVFVLPPMIPEFPGMGATTNGSRGLVYSGKLDKHYSVEAYLSLPPRLAAAGVHVEFVGDKFTRVQGDVAFPARMRVGLESTQGILWHKGVERKAALELMSKGLFGLCWRGARYDASLEISTKLLEFCALGVPPLVNKTDLHLELLGSDYPYFVSSLDDIVAAVQRAIDAPAEYADIKRRIQGLAPNFSFGRIAHLLEDELQRSGIKRRVAVSARPGPRRRVLIAGHDNKFLKGVLTRLEQEPGLDIRYDRWTASRKHDERQSAELLGWADVVFCEWCAGAAVWYSQRVEGRKKCYVRLHRYEAFEKETSRVNFTNVERLIVVSDHFRNICMTQFGMDGSRIDVIPQYVDWKQFNRAKHPWAEFTLGIVGINGYFHKRFDRALDILRELRTGDARWRLRVRSVMPWEIGWVWKRKDEVEQFRAQFARILSDPVLRDGVCFDPTGPDMEEWFRHVGFILSTSDSEGCHTSVAEGMASGAIPAIYHWPGAASVYPKEFVFDSVAGMVESIRRAAAQGALARERERVAEIAKAFDVEVTRSHLCRLFEAG